MKKQLVTKVRFLEEIIYKGSRLKMIATRNKEYRHFSLSFKSPFLSISNEKSPDVVVRVPFTNIVYLEETVEE